MELIQGLLDICQDSVLDFLELILDKAIFFLIHLDLLEDKVAFTPAGIHKDICLGTPGELVNTWLDDLVETSQVLSEQLLLVLVDELYDVVVVAHNQHHVLTQLPQSISFRILTCQRRWDLQRVQGLDFVPILHLNQVSQQLGVEVA